MLGILFCKLQYMPNMNIFDIFFKRVNEYNIQNPFYISYV